MPNPLNRVLDEIAAVRRDIPDLDFVWGQVQTDLRVLLDGEDEPLADPPTSMIPLVVGARVFMLRYQRRIIVLGPLAS